MAGTIGRAVILVLTGVVAGLAFNHWSSRGLPVRTPPRIVLADQEVISLADAEQLLGGGFFLDARPAADYVRGHIAGAFNLPQDDFEAHFAQVAGLLASDAPIVVYCDGADCELSHQVHARLKELGFTNARVLINGWTVWRNAGLPSHEGTEP